MVIECSAPVRIDFAGAWTDVPIFADQFGGATLNAAIDLRVRGQLSDGVVTQVQGPSGAQAVRQDGISVSYEMHLPAGSGLGTSAAMNVLWLALVRREEITSLEERERLAAISFDLEHVLGIVGGKQDQYASAVGGINLFEFRDGEARTNPLELSDEQVAALGERLVLCYTGKPRLSSRIHEHVWGHFRAGNRDMIDALFTLRDSAYEARDALQAGDFERFGELLTLQFQSAKRLHESTSNEMIEDLFTAVSPHAAGFKPCGAGGGGCLLVCCHDRNARDAVERIIQERGLQLQPFEFDFEGLKVEIGEG